MQPRTDAPKSTSVPAAPAATPPVEAARRAVSADALAARVKELEWTLSAERSQNAARAREIESGVKTLRRTLQELQAETARVRDENARLHEQLDQSRRVVAEMSTTTRAGAGLAELEDALDQARDDAAASREQLADARRDLAAATARVDALEQDVGARDHELTRLSDHVAELEATLASARRAALSAAAPAGQPPAQVEALNDDLPTHDDDLLTNDDEPPAAAAPSPAPVAAPAADVAENAAARILAAGARNDAERAAREEPQDPALPQVPGLRIERFVEEGATGLVYEAREVASRRPVLVRLLPGVLRLLDGKRLDSVLLAKHPNLVSVLSFAVCRQGPYLVMEREDGETATQWIARIGTLPERIALSVMLEAARGLRQAAFHGATHGDLGPEAVLIETSGRVRIRGVGLRAVYAQQGDAPCAPEYASPERLRGSPPADVRSDLYSLGAILHFLLTGKPPYEGDRDAVLRQQAANSVPDVREVRHDVSEETAKLARKLLSSDADLRPQTWDQLLVELERRVPGRVSTALRGNLATRTRRFLTAHPWVLGAALAGVLFIAGLYRMFVAHDPTAAERFREACGVAEALAANGDLEGARTVYRRFLAETGDPEVEREAARRFDEIGRKPK